MSEPLLCVRLLNEFSARYNGKTLNLARKRQCGEMFVLLAWGGAVSKQHLIQAVWRNNIKTSIDDDFSIDADKSVLYKRFGENLSQLKATLKEAGAPEAMVVTAVQAAGTEMVSLDAKRVSTDVVWFQKRIAAARKLVRAADADVAAIHDDFRTIRACRFIFRALAQLGPKPLRYVPCSNPAYGWIVEKKSMLADWYCDALRLLVPCITSEPALLSEREDRSVTSVNLVGEGESSDSTIAEPLPNWVMPKAVRQIETTLPAMLEILAARIDRAAWGDTVRLALAVYDEASTDASLKLAIGLAGDVQKEIEFLSAPLQDALQRRIAAIKKKEQADLQEKRLRARLANQRQPKRVGHEEPIRAVRFCILKQAPNLLMITGPTGVGKSRVLAEALKDSAFASRFSERVFVIDLDSRKSISQSQNAINDEELVLKILSAMGEMGPHRDPIGRVKQLLAQSTLLALDNADALLSDARITSTSALLQEIIPEGSGSIVVITACRDVDLGFSEKIIVDVDPLAVPDRVMPLADLRTYPGFQLLEQEIRTVAPDFIITEAIAPILQQVCVDQGGLPLGIVLASAWFGNPACKTASQEDLRSLVQSKSMPGPDRRRSDAIKTRFRSLDEAIAFSYQLLGTEERQSLFRQIAVFEGGCTLDAVHQICRPELPVGPSYYASGEHRVTPPSESTGELLEVLWEYRLIQPTDATGTRFALRIPFQAFARQQWKWAEQEEVERNHAAFYRRLVAEADTRSSPERYAILQADYANIRCAVEWEINHPSVEGVDLLVRLRTFWQSTGRWKEGVAACQRMLSAYQTAPVKSLAQLRNTYGILLDISGEYEEARTQLEDALRTVDLGLIGSIAMRDDAVDALDLTHISLADSEKWRWAKLIKVRAEILQNQAIVLRHQGNFKDARQKLRHAWRACMVLPAGGIDSIFTQIAILNTAGSICLGLNCRRSAKSFYLRALRLTDRFAFHDPNNRARAVTLINYAITRGDLAKAPWELTEAERCYDKALRIFETLGDRSMVGLVLHNHATLLRKQQNPDLSDARTYAFNSLRIRTELRDRAGARFNMELLILISHLLGQHEWVAQLSAMEKRLRDSLQVPITKEAERELEAAQQVAKGALGDQYDLIYQSAFSPDLHLWETVERYLSEIEYNESS